MFEEAKEKEKRLCTNIKQSIHWMIRHDECRNNLISRSFAVFPTLADVVAVKIGLVSTSRWSIRRILVVVLRTASLKSILILSAKTGHTIIGVSKTFYLHRIRNRFRN